MNEEAVRVAYRLPVYFLWVDGLAS